jgi:hypothetical protein
MFDLLAVSDPFLVIVWHLLQWFGQRLGGNRPIISEIFKLRMIFYRTLV